MSRARAKRTSVTCAIVVLITCGLTQPVVAQDVANANALETPRGLALGTGARASALSTSALAYNAANLPIGELYHLEGLVGLSPADKRWSLGAAVVDSVTSAVGAGFAFRGILSSEDDGYDGLDGKLGVAFPFSNALSIGIAGRYVSLQSEDPAEGEEPGPDVKGFTMEGAITLRPTEGLSISALGYNFIDRDSELVPVLVGGSAAFTFSQGFTIGADGLVDLSTFDNAKLIAGGGAEYLAGGMVPLRLGYRYDDGRELHSITGGVGYVDAKFGIDVSIAQEVGGGDGTELLLGIRYHVQ